ncbi:MAG: RecX family transcriptional regulator, partial [Clostridia bacterium]|nr:RecX family transcriptional regulator [Clostridia bacterium]
MAKILATKYLKGKNLEDEKTKEKLFRHLISRGYSYGV